MSIEIKNPKTKEEKLDAVANLIEQMYLANATHNNAMFMKAYQKAQKLMHDIIYQNE